MFQNRLRTGLAHVGQALREPEAFALHWHREPSPYAWWVFAALALMASIPINWFFTVAVPIGWFALLVNLVVFTGVGVAMVDVFCRVMERLEPARGRAPGWWLALVGAIGGELFYAFGLFDFSVIKQLFAC